MGNPQAPIRPLELRKELLAAKNFTNCPESSISEENGDIAFVDNGQNMAVKIEANGKTSFGRIIPSEAGHTFVGKPLTDKNGDGALQDGDSGMELFADYQRFLRHVKGCIQKGERCYAGLPTSIKDVFNKADIRLGDADYKRMGHFFFGKIGFFGNEIVASIIYDDHTTPLFRIIKRDAAGCRTGDEYELRESHTRQVGDRIEDSQTVLVNLAGEDSKVCVSPENPRWLTLEAAALLLGARVLKE